MSRDPSLRIEVHVQPRASKTEIVGPHGQGIKIRLAAPPVDGAANAALIDFLADKLHLPRRLVRIVQGCASRQKLVEIDDCAPETRRRLAVLLKNVDKREPHR